MSTRSEAQIAASRANGAKSKGPVTPEGKRVCAMNALKHGGAAQCVVLACEDDFYFQELQRDFILEYRPKTRTETELVETLAEARWSYQRMVAMRKLALDRDVEILPQSLGTPPERLMLALTEPGNHTSGPARHDRLLRYQMAHDRHFHRTLKALLALQDRNTRDPELAGSEEPYVPTAPSLPTFLPEPLEADPAPNPEQDPEQNSTEQTQAADAMRLEPLSDVKDARTSAIVQGQSATAPSEPCGPSSPVAPRTGTGIGHPQYYPLDLDLGNTSLGELG